ncbi:Hypothetical predicted protein [Octopus vulgaris]|uniref:Uncharacterized protein n=1 Tax=Octopus vulgaris TaxID=6645 RepID=A0AA36AEW0_OCTVU|nr:Hypothetical predicted protein [Octopus vulgaris]
MEFLVEYFSRYRCRNRYKCSTYRNETVGCGCLDVDILTRLTGHSTCFGERSFTEEFSQLLDIISNFIELNDSPTIFSRLNPYHT